jgi:hypothetical protein
MELTIESAHPVPTPRVVSASPAWTATVHPTVDEAGLPAGSGSPAYSFWAECECPADCLRDHANE